MYMSTRRRAAQIHSEMLADLGYSLVAAKHPNTVQTIYLETRLMVLRLQPNTRENRRTARAIRWLLEYVVAGVASKY